MKLALKILFLLLMCFSVKATDIYFNLIDFSQNPATNRNILVQSFSLPTVFSGSIPLSGQIPYTSDPVTGQFTITNAVLNILYQVRILAPPAQTIFQIYAPNNISGNATYNGALFACGELREHVPRWLSGVERGHI